MSEKVLTSCFSILESNSTDSSWPYSSIWLHVFKWSIENRLPIHVERKHWKKYQITIKSIEWQAHIDECGQILEKCPNKCVAYVERKLIADHLRECGKVGDKSVTKTSARSTDNDDRFVVMEENVVALRTVLNEEIRQRHRLISDVGDLRKKNQNTEEWITRVGDVLTVLKKCLNDETEMRTTEIKNCKEDIERLMYQYKVCKTFSAARTKSKFSFSSLLNFHRTLKNGAKSSAICSTIFTRILNSETMSQQILKRFLVIIKYLFRK